MKSLLNTSLWRFIMCTVVVLLLTTPLFYMLTEHFYAEDIIDLMTSIRKGLPIPALDIKKDIMVGIMIQFALIFFVLSLSLIITMRFVTKHIWSPFYDTLRKIKQFNLEQSQRPEFLITDIGEFKELNAAVNQLINRNMESYKVQRNFTENASHELQAPIAVFQSKLDLLLQEDLTREQAELISELYAISDRLNKLNRNLLLLAKIENRQYSQMQQIDIHAFIEKNISFYKDLYGDRSINLTDDNDSPLIIEANYSLLESLFNNLLVNAIRYSSTTESIEIHLKGTTLSVVNGSDDGMLDEKKIFQRFSGSYGKNKGNGLGLAIVKAICNYHDWSIQYSYDDHKHCFSVLFC